MINKVISDNPMWDPKRGRKWISGDYGVLFLGSTKTVAVGDYIAGFRVDAKSEAKHDGDPATKFVLSDHRGEVGRLVIANDWDEPTPTMIEVLRTFDSREYWEEFISTAKLGVEGYEQRPARTLMNGQEVIIGSGDNRHSGVVSEVRIGPVIPESSNVGVLFNMDSSEEFGKEHFAFVEDLIYVKTA